jgi:hypothetical protein
MMMRTLSLMAVVLFALGACATLSTAPEASNPKVRELCYVRDEPQWVQIAPPENAQAYRDAWPQAAEGRVYSAPRWPEDEFWFRTADGAIKLCTGNPFYHEERCGAGTTVDFTESANGLVASNSGEPICIL